MLYMLWFNFILGSNFIFPLFQTHYRTLITIPKNKGIKDKIEQQHILIKNLYESLVLDKPILLIVKFCAVQFDWHVCFNL